MREVRLNRAALRLLRRTQALKPYRALARRLIEKKVRYRIATPGDAHDLSRLYGYERFPELGDPIRAFAGQIENLKGCGYALVASVRGRIAGVAIIRQFHESKSLYPDWWLFGMLVRTRYRGTGIGEGLVRMAMEKAVEEGTAKMNLLVFEREKAAINLYHKMGFRPASIAGLDGQLLEEVQQGSPRRIIMSTATSPGGNMGNDPSIIKHKYPVGDKKIESSEVRRIREGLECLAIFRWIQS